MELLIQKVCACCPYKLLDLFTKFLEKNNNKLSVSLVKAIQANPNGTNIDYAQVIYKSSNNDALKKLNQLSYHTLKLFSFISQNFPSFLWHNLTDIEWLIFKNEKEKLSEKIKLIKEVADKFENYHLLIQLYRIVSQQIGIDTQITNSFENEKTLTYLNQIENLILVQNKIIKAKTSSKKMVTTNELTFFKDLFHSKSKSVEILAKQSYLNLLSTCNHDLFYHKDTLELINNTIKETEKNGYLMIAQYTEKMMSLDYMLVKHTRLTLNEKDMQKSCSSIIKKWQNYYSTESKLDIGLTMAMSIKGSYYITEYYFNSIPKKLLNEIENITTFIAHLLQNVSWQTEGYLKYINLCNVQALYFVLENKPKQAIQLIEKVLHEYQQRQFSKLYDGIFVILIMAYFQDQQYEKVCDTYNRYKKVTKGEVSVQENDLIIKALYYLAQLKLKESKQYLIKYNDVVQELSKNKLMINNLNLIERVKNTIL